jgi:AcrR family transcriptional regulator
MARERDSTRAWGRQAEAARNDVLILAAARAVLSEFGSDAPMSAIAERAGVGQGTLYRRYESKDELLRQLCISSTREAAAEAADALASEEDSWSALTRLVRWCAEVGFGAFGVTAGSFTVTQELLDAVGEMRDAVLRIVNCAREEGSLRSDIGDGDIFLIFDRLQRQRVHTKPGRDFDKRYVALILEGLRAPTGEALPGAPTTWEDVSRSWAASS